MALPGLKPRSTILTTSTPNHYTTDVVLKHIRKSMNANWLYCKQSTRRVPLVGQELRTLPEHSSSPPVFSGVRVTRFLVLYLWFVHRCLSFYPFSFGHCVLCYTDSDCPFGIFKLFLNVTVEVFYSAFIVSNVIHFPDLFGVNLHLEAD